MRNPERIPEVLAEIERIWRMYPDMRLGQLVSNIADWAETSVWDIEEDDLTAEIQRHLANREAIENEGVDAIPQEQLSSTDR